MSKARHLSAALCLLTVLTLGWPGRVRAAAAEAAPAPATGLSAVPRAISAPGGCPEPSLEIAPLPAGQARIDLRSPCRANEEIQISYAGLEFFRRLDREGRLDFLFDCIAGPDEPAQFRFLDGSVLQRIVPAHDLDQVTKVAVVWRGSVNLDLHAFEYAAQFGAPGHVWAGAPSSLAEAQAASVRDGGRVHGFLSVRGDGRSKGDQMEVYTLWRGRPRPGALAAAHAAGGAPMGGIIALALDYESRETQPQDVETCGSGVFSEIAYQIVTREPNGSIKRVSGAFSPLECGMRLQNASRYNTKTIPFLK